MKPSKSLTLLAALALACTLPGTVRAQIFVADLGNGTGYGFIREYAFDGSQINTSLISGLNDPFGLAISGGDIFVANNLNGTVGEYTLAGAPVNTSLVSGLSGPWGLAVIPDLFHVGDSDLFVVNNTGNSIDEYTVSGGVATATGLHITVGLNSPTGIAISGGDIFVANHGNAANGTIGEYTLAGAPVNTALISGAGVDYATGLAISGGDIFVINDGDYVSEYTTSGATVNNDLFGYGNSMLPAGLAIAGNNIFVAATPIIGGSPHVGEYTTSGGTVNASLISTVVIPTGIATVGTPAPEPSTMALMAFGVAALFGLRRHK